MKITDFAKKAKKQFARDYHSEATLFCIYDSFKFYYQKYIGFKFSRVLIYRSKKEAEIYLLKSECSRFDRYLEDKINSGFVKKAIVQYAEKIKEIKFLIKKKYLSEEQARRFFDVNSEILSLERIIFLVPHIVLDHGVKMADKKLVDYCQEERQRTEKLFYKVDRFFKDKKINSVPSYLKHYQPGVKEFIIFDDKFITDQKIINSFKKIQKAEAGSSGKKTIKGFTAYKGKVKGVARLVFSKKDYQKVKEGDILVTSNTNPDYLPIIKKAAAIVTDEGGLLCHAAIVSREFKIPCVVGAKIATQVLKDGDLVEVDADKGIVRALNKQ